MYFLLFWMVFDLKVNAFVILIILPCFVPTPAYDAEWFYLHARGWGISTEY